MSIRTSAIRSSLLEGTSRVSLKDNSVFLSVSAEKTFVCLLLVSVTAGSPAHPQAATWKWGPVRGQMWTHLEVTLHTILHTVRYRVQQDVSEKHGPPHFLSLLTFWLCDSFLESVCDETADWPLGTDDLLRFSFQVAQGLDFLAAKNVSDFSMQIYRCLIS